MEGVMQPRREEQRKDTEPRKEEKQPRFRLVRLEERIAPRNGSSFGNLKNSKGCSTLCPW